MTTRPKILGQLLLEAGHVRVELLEEALGPARRVGERVGETLVRMGRLSGEDVARALSVQLALPYAERPLSVDAAARDAVQPELVRMHRVLPLSVTPRTLRVAMVRVFCFFVFFIFINYLANPTDIY